MTQKWDNRFLDLAEHIASWSKDPSTQVGAVLVSPDKSYVVHGYNGFPRGVWDDKALYKNKEEKYKRVVHAELNAILNSPIRPVGWTLYITPIPPCTECTKAIIQSGIKRIVYRVKEEMNEKWVKEFQTSLSMLGQADVVVEVAQDGRVGHEKQGSENLKTPTRDCC